MISLVVSTIGRTTQLDTFLASLDAQTCRDFEVVIVDQNLDDRILPVLARHSKLMIRHIRSERGLSRGRNCGMELVTGDIVATPDDDCWYPPALLDSVKNWFASHLDVQGLLTAVRDEDDHLQGPRRRSASACQCDRISIWYCGISFNAFLRREVVQSVGKFDECLGVGSHTIFQSGEETDYFLRALASGYQIWYDPELHVHHPNLRELKKMLRQAYPYALGTGYVLRKHQYPLSQICGPFFLYPFLAAAVALCRLEIGVAAVRVLRGVDQLVGFARVRHPHSHQSVSCLPGGA